MEKYQIDKQENIGKVNAISHDKLPPVPENSACMLHHSLYPKPKRDLEEIKISEKNDINYKYCTKTMMI